tara:strand:+ start:103 stop:615 length:513 start_codon:yes stop_codon:yes gene_type:complete
MKAKKSYDKGGKMKQGASKRPQPRSNLSGQPTTRQELMQQHREERKSRLQNMTKEEMDKYRKPVNRFDKGGKVKNQKRTAQSDTLERTKEQVLENARVEKRKPLLFRGADGPGRSEYIKQEKAAQGPLKKIKPKKASPVASKPLPAKKLKKSKAVIPVPPAKGRRRRNRK